MHKLGSDALSLRLQPTLHRRGGLQQVDLGASVHLALDEFELGDLAFGLWLAP